MKNILKRWNLLTKQEKTIVISSLAFLGLLIFLLVYAGIMSGRSSDNSDTKSESKPNTEISPDQGPEKEEEKLPTNISPLSGQECENYQQRPVAVMMAADNLARPLSALSKADIVVEMPVITGSVTRLMGVYVCNLPDEVGSVRSARHDYISLARGWDAIFVHWGGSHFALDELKTGIRYTGENLGKISNIDAMSASGPFFRRSHVPAPHNGFVSLPKVIELSKSRGYSLTTDLKGYQFMGSKQIDSEKAEAKSGTVYVGFAGVFATRFDYSPDSNSYTRYWAGKKDSDKLTNTDITPKNIIVIRANSRQIEGQYNTVNIYGQGEGKIYQNGKEKSIIWKKDGFKDIIRFYEDGEEIKLVPGQTFIEVIEPTQSLKWEVN